MKKSNGISVPERREYDGNPVLLLPVGHTGTPLTLGVAKCRAILRYLPEIEDFVNTVEEGRRNERRVRQEECPVEPSGL